MRSLIRWLKEDVFPEQGVFDYGERIVAGRWTAKYKSFEEPKYNFGHIDINGWRIIGQPYSGETYNLACGFTMGAPVIDDVTKFNDQQQRPYIFVGPLKNKVGAWVATCPFHKKAAIALDSGGEFGKMLSLRVLAVQISNSRKKHKHWLVARFVTWLNGDKKACDKICEYIGASASKVADYPGDDWRKMMEDKCAEWGDKAKKSGKRIPPVQQRIMRKYGYLPEIKKPASWGGTIEKEPS